MNFALVNGNLTLTISQDSAGHLTGTAVSTPPLCSFNQPVTGSYFTTGQQFQVISADSNETFTGTLSGDQKSLSGTVQLGNAQTTGCGPRTGLFQVAKQ
jgi:hypothetical protein